MSCGPARRTYVVVPPEPDTEGGQTPQTPKLLSHLSLCPLLRGLTADPDAGEVVVLGGCEAPLVVLVLARDVCEVDSVGGGLVDCGGGRGGLVEND